MKWHKATGRGYNFYYLKPDASSLTIDECLKDGKFILFDNDNDSNVGVFTSLGAAQVMYLMLRHQYTSKNLYGMVQS